MIKLLLNTLLVTWILLGTIPFMTDYNQYSKDIISILWGYVFLLLVVIKVFHNLIERVDNVRK